MTSIGMRDSTGGEEYGLDLPSPNISRRSRLSLQREAAVGIDVEDRDMGEMPSVTGRVSDVELMRGDRRASLRSSLLSRSRASVSTIGAAGLDDEIPAFDDQVIASAFECKYGMRF